MKHSRIIFPTLFILCAALCAGRLYADFTYDKAHTFPAKANTRVYEEKQSKILVFSTIHSRCGHTTEYRDNSPVEFFSVEELAASFPSWEITGGDDEVLIFTRYADDICPLHYTAKSDSGRIVITSDNNGRVVYEFSVNYAHLSDEDKSALKNGVHLSGKDALTSFIEDFTS